MKILELFSGYGTASFALKQLGIDYELVGYSDIDKYANQCFKQNHGGKELGDVKNINPYELNDFDLLTGGFPCQSFSVAGKGLGELDTRGTLFNEIIRIAEVKQPRYMLLENVKGLTFKNHKKTFDNILEELDRIGYIVKWKIYNTKNYGIPQNRERVFFVCFHKDYYNYGDWEEPEEEELKLFLKDILEDEVDEKYYLSEKQINKLKQYLGKKNKINAEVMNCVGTCFGRSGSSQEELESFARTNKALIYDKASKKFTEEFYWVNKENDKSRPSYLQFQNGHHSEVYRYYNINGIMQTIKENSLKIIKPQIRKLTPKECFRLQGFLNDEVNLDGLSNAQQYKLAGNGQSVNVVKKIFKNMFANLGVSAQ